MRKPSTNPAPVTALNTPEVWPREMELSVADRLWLYGLLPREGDVTSLRLVRQLREELSFTEEENEKFEIRNESGTFRWNVSKGRNKKLLLGRAAWELIAAALRSLEAKKKLPLDCLDLYDRFVC